MAGDRRSRAGGSGRVRSPKNGRSERPFDVWLNRQLHTMYDDIAREPIPREVVELIERDARAAQRQAEPDAQATGADEVPPPPAPRENEQG